MSNLSVELLFYHGGNLLEGPHWNNGLLYFVSIRNNMIFSIDPVSKTVKVYETDGAVGVAVIDSDGDILEAEKDGIFKMNLKTKEKTLVAHPETDPKIRYNDGHLDAKGRLLVGTMGDLERSGSEGKLFSVEKNGDCKVLIEGTTISNGLGFSSDNKTFYFIDTPTQKVMAYDYGLETGDISNERVFVEFDFEKDGSPDGMCVDIDDNIWVAHWGGGKVSKFCSKTGERLVEIDMPVTNVTSCCVGGENMDTLFVTTAQATGKNEMVGGGLFKLKIR